MKKNFACIWWDFNGFFAIGIVDAISVAAVLNAWGKNYTVIFVVLKVLLISYELLRLNEQNRIV